MKRRDFVRGLLAFAAIGIIAKANIEVEAKNKPINPYDGKIHRWAIEREGNDVTYYVDETVWIQ